MFAFVRVWLRVCVCVCVCVGCLYRPKYSQWCHFPVDFACTMYTWAQACTHIHCTYRCRHMHKYILHLCKRPSFHAYCNAQIHTGTCVFLAYLHAGPTKSQCEVSLCTWRTCIHALILTHKFTPTHTIHLSYQNTSCKWLHAHIRLAYDIYICM